MKSILWTLTALCGLSFGSCCTTTDRADSQPMAVIFDTDIGNDIDDVLALQMLFNYEKAGKIELRGITLSKSNPHSIAFADGYCRFANRADMPLGFAYNGVNPEDNSYLLPTLTAQVDGQPVLQPLRSIGPEIPEGYKLLRKLLTEADNNSITLIAVGPLTNIARLLESPGDELNDKTGLELVCTKVKVLAVMSGLYGDAFDFPEWNVIQDLPASKVVYAQCPVPIIASGWELGNELLYPHQSILNDFGDPNRHPLSIAYQHYMQMPYDRQTWDLTTVLDIIEPEAGYFVRSPKGTITITDDGKSLFAPSDEGLHQYLTIPKEKIETTLAAIVNQTTGKTAKN